MSYPYRAVCRPCGWEGAEFALQVIPDMDSQDVERVCPRCQSDDVNYFAPTEIHHGDAARARDELDALRLAVQALLAALDDEQERGALRVSTWTYVTRVRGLIGDA